MLRVLHDGATSLGRPIHLLSLVLFIPGGGYVRANVRSEGFRAID